MTYYMPTNWKTWKKWIILRNLQPTKTEWWRIENLNVLMSKEIKSVSKISQQTKTQDQMASLMNSTKY